MLKQTNIKIYIYFKINFFIASNYIYRILICYNPYKFDKTNLTNSRLLFYMKLYLNFVL